MSTLPPEQSKYIHPNPHTWRLTKGLYRFSMRGGVGFHTTGELFGSELGSKAHRNVEIKLVNSEIVKKASAIL